jgi:hypothetical protein
MGGEGSVCDACGAERCEARFHACLAADFTDPRFGAVHHLVVPAYALQHGWYTEDAEHDIVQFVLARLHRPPDDRDRRRVRADADGPARVLARPPRPRRLPWTHHVGHVDLRDPDRYTATVRAWAASVATALRDRAAATGGGAPDTGGPPANRGS